MTESLRLSVSESVFESVSESIPESIKESISESVSESVSESLSESTSSSESASSSESVSTLLNEASSEAASSSSSSSTDTSSSSSSTEAREVLEQVTSEAEILVQIANGQTTPSQELTDSVAVSTKEIVAAKLILGNTEATAEEIQTVVDSVQNSSQALGALLIKDDEDGIIIFALDTTTTATVTKVGEGYARQTHEEKNVFRNRKS